MGLLDRFAEFTSWIDRVEGGLRRFQRARTGAL